MALAASMRHILLLPPCVAHRHWTHAPGRGEKKEKEMCPPTMPHADGGFLREPPRYVSQSSTSPVTASHPLGTGQRGGEGRVGDDRRRTCTPSREIGTQFVFFFLLTDRDLASLCLQSKKKKIKTQNKATVQGQIAQCNSQCDGLLRSMWTVGNGSTASPQRGFEEKSSFKLFSSFVLGGKRQRK